MNGGPPRLDHVAVAVRDTDAALEYFRDRLGLEVVHDERLDVPPVRLTYLDAGGIAIQLVQPLRADTDLARSLEARGEGLHHLCFAAADPVAAAAALTAAGDPPPAPGRGRGRVSAFVPGAPPHGVLVEFTATATPSSASA